ncbi:MAG: AMP-binding protein [bacterium]
MNNIYRILQETTEKFPEKEALIFKDHRINYEKLKSSVDRLASGLKELGFKKGDRIALMLPNIPHFVICFFAGLKLGLTILPISIYYKTEEVHHRLEDAEVKGIIYLDKFREIIFQAVRGLDRCKHLIVLADQANQGEIRLNGLMEVMKPLQETEQINTEDTAIISYTAGVTGFPKGAQLTHGNILFDINAFVSYIKFDHNDIVMGVIPLSHPLGFTLIMGAFIYCGGSIMLIPQLNVSRAFDIVEKEKVTCFIAVPSVIKEIVENKNFPDKKVSSLKYCISSGDAMDPEIFKKFEDKYHVAILESYGLTEASPLVSLNNPFHERIPGSIGFPLPGVEMRFINEDGEPIKPGEIGEIQIKGENIMKGYLNKPEATKEVIQEGWLKTGDYIVLHESGYKKIVARRKNMIIKSGFNIYPREVEKFLSGHPKVKEAVVFGIPDSQVGEEVTACIVLNDSEKADEKEFIEYLQQRMAAYKCPQKVYFRDEFPKGPTGRILTDKVKEELLKSVKN